MYLLMHNSITSNLASEPPIDLVIPYFSSIISPVFVNLTRNFVRASERKYILLLKKPLTKMTPTLCARKDAKPVILESNKFPKRRTAGARGPYKRFARDRNRYTDELETTNKVNALLTSSPHLHLRISVKPRTANNPMGTLNKSLPLIVSSPIRNRAEVTAKKTLK